MLNSPSFLDSGKLGTIVYHGLDGYGIIWGVDCLIELLREDELPIPEAMLRDPYPTATLPCVGEKYIVVSQEVPLIPISAETAFHLFEIEDECRKHDWAGMPEPFLDALYKAFPTLAEEMLG